MTGELINHLWQSTLCAAALGLLTALFRKDRAEVRYWLWFGASCKFFLPFSLLINLGSHIAQIAVVESTAPPSAYFKMGQFAQPFSAGSSLAFHTTENAADWITLASFVFWACGSGVIVLLRLHGWRQIRAAVASSVAINVPAAFEVRSSHGLLEPGVVGLFRPILLLPAGIEERLTPAQFRAVLAHESCHVRRRDNLTSSIHMLAEAMFWFHPFIWWIGVRLVQERERACDEAVLRLGNEPQEYAEAILHVCKRYLESPLRCVAGVTGSDLRQRIQAILEVNVARELTIAKRLILTAAGAAVLTLPIVTGALHAPSKQIQSVVDSAVPTFEAASVHSCTAFRRNTPDSWSPGRLRSECTTLRRLIQQAFGLFGSGHVNPGSSLNVTGGPAWAASELYEIDAKAAGPQSRGMMNGPIMRKFLADKFKLKVHHEMRNAPVYQLTAVSGGGRLTPFDGTCRLRDFDDPPSYEDCGTANLHGNGFNLKAASMTDLCAAFLVLLDRPVIDKTGVAGRFNMHVELSAEDRALLHHPRSLPALSDPAARASTPINFEVVNDGMKALGLNLASVTGPVEFIVIDRIDRP